MNSLNILENGILAAADSLQELSNKENLRILVLSDSHGAKDILLQIIKKNLNDLDAIIFCGDGIYDFFSAIEAIKFDWHLKKNLPKVIAFVKGNNDPGHIITEKENAIEVPSKVLLKAGARTILVTHGHSEGVYYDFSRLEANAEIFGANAVLFGHTHVPSEFMGKTYLMNPGSISCPRHKSFPGFAILEILGPNINSIFYRIESFSPLKISPYFPEPFYGF